MKELYDEYISNKKKETGLAFAFDTCYMRFDSQYDCWRRCEFDDANVIAVCMESENIYLTEYFPLAEPPEQVIDLMIDKVKRA